MLESDICAEARLWLDTPYHWRARTRGLGADCGTFVWEVLNVFYRMPPMPQSYRESWMLDGDENYFLDMLQNIGQEIGQYQHGCVALFWFGRQWGHCAIVDAPRFIRRVPHIFHCYGRKGIGGVVRQPLAVFAEREKRYFVIKEEFLRG